MGAMSKIISINYVNLFGNTKNITETMKNGLWYSCC